LFVSGSGACVCVREKNGVTAPMGACKVFLRLRGFAVCFCVSLTHTHLSELSLSPSRDDLWRRDSSCPVNMPGNRHANKALHAAGFSGSCCCPFTLLSLSLTAVKPAKISHILKLSSNCRRVPCEVYFSIQNSKESYEHSIGIL